MPISYFHLLPDAKPPVLALAPFRAVLHIDLPVSAEWMGRIAEWLVSSGCLYAMCWGIACEEWHDSIDWAVLKAFNFEDIPEDRFVMTTWHSNEPVSEVYWYSEHCANHSDVALTDTVIIHVTHEAQKALVVKAFMDAQLDADGA